MDSNEEENDDETTEDEDDETSEKKAMTLPMPMMNIFRSRP
jgi:hypothetical protein